MGVAWWVLLGGCKAAADDLSDWQAAGQLSGLMSLMYQFNAIRGSLIPVNVACYGLNAFQLSVRIGSYDQERRGTGTVGIMIAICCNATLSA